MWEHISQRVEVSLYFKAFSGGLRRARNCTIHDMEVYKEIAKVYRDQMAAVCKLFSLLALFALLACTALVCIIASREVDMSGLQRSQNWDRGLYIFGSGRQEKCLSYSYSGLPCAEDALGGA